MQILLGLLLSMALLAGAVLWRQRHYGPLHVSEPWFVGVLIAIFGLNFAVSTVALPGLWLVVSWGSRQIAVWQGWTSGQGALEDHFMPGTDTQTILLAV